MHGSAKRAGAIIVVVAGLVATLLSASATAASSNTNGSSTKPIGGVLLRPGVASHAASTTTSAPTTASSSTPPNLRYHGGAVMRTNTTHVIYWIPSGYLVRNGFMTSVDQYFADAAADSGTDTNVYSTLNQYYDTLGGSQHFIQYQQTFAGSVIDTHSFPSNGCPRYDGFNKCLTDAQVSGEMDRFGGTQGWTGGPTDAYIVMLPKDVGQCFDPNGRTCAFDYYCAYHSVTSNKPSAFAYAVIPYAGSTNWTKGCGSKSSIAGNDADYVFDSASHEHREMINDGMLTAWWDRNGDEGSDKCVYKYGAAIGTTLSGQKYNQLINGNPYKLQMEWSNASHACVQRGI